MTKSARKRDEKPAAPDSYISEPTMHRPIRRPHYVIVIAVSPQMRARHPTARGL
jgi:hypothetical protein